LFCTTSAHFVLHSICTFCFAQHLYILFCTASVHFVLHSIHTFCFAQHLYILFCATSVHFVLHNICTFCFAQHLYILCYMPSVHFVLHSCTFCFAQHLYILCCTTSVHFVLHNVCTFCVAQHLYILCCTTSIYFVLHNICTFCVAQHLYILCCTTSFECIKLFLCYIIYPFLWYHFQINIKHNGGQTQDSPAGIVSRSCAGQPRVQSLPVTRYALFSKLCRPVPGTTHPPTQGLLKDFPPHIKQLKHAVDHSLSHSAKLKKWNPHLAFSFMVLINRPLHA
jgi:hypothetical protein